MILTIRYTNGIDDVFISAIKVSHQSIAYTIAHFEATKRESNVRVTHYLNTDKLYGFGNAESDWIRVPYYLS